VVSIGKDKTMLRAILTAFAISLIVAGCPGYDPGNIRKDGPPPTVPPEAGDMDDHYSEDMLCEPIDPAAGGGGGGAGGGGSATGP
jgi:hypothetical protein